MARSFSPQRLRDLRCDAGVTREQLAVATNRTYWTIDAYERGHATPPLPVAVILADEIGCDVCDFLDTEVPVEGVMRHE